MARQYFSLVSRKKNSNEPWALEFGDYEKSVVVYEKDDTAYTAKTNRERIEFKIIKTEDSSEAISIAMAKLRSDEIAAIAEKTSRELDKRYPRYQTEMGIFEGYGEFDEA